MSWTMVPAPSRSARDILVRAAAARRCMLALQSIGEFYAAATRKRLVPPGAAARAARDWMALFPVVEPVAADALSALEAAAAGRFAYWDALLLTTLGRAGCAVILSKDMHDGAVLAGVTVRNPFLDEALPALLD